MIFVDATPMQSEHRVRGVGHYTRHLCTELTRTLDPEKLSFLLEKGERDELPATMKERGISIWRPHKPAQVYWMYNELIFRRALSKYRPTLFHATDFNGVVVSKSYRTVATVHDLTGLNIHQGTKNLATVLSDLRWKVYYQRKLPAVDHVIAISEHVRNELVQVLGYPAHRVTVIPHGIDTALYHPWQGEGRFATSGFYVTYLGSAEEHKNLDRLLEAFAMVVKEQPHLKFLAAGKWNTEQITKFYTLASQLEIRDRVHHLGFLSVEDKISLLSNASAFLFPSLSEGFGLPVLEAMACGTPVLTSSTSVLPEVAGDAAYLVDPLSTEDMSAGIRELVSNEVQSHDLVTRGFQRVKAFSWETTARKTIEVYKHVLHHSPIAVEGVNRP